MSRKKNQTYDVDFYFRFFPLFFLLLYREKRNVSRFPFFAFTSRDKNNACGFYTRTKLYLFLFSSPRRQTKKARNKNSNNSASLLLSTHFFLHRRLFLVLCRAPSTKQTFCFSSRTKKKRISSSLHVVSGQETTISVLKRTDQGLTKTRTRREESRKRKRKNSTGIVVE